MRKFRKPRQVGRFKKPSAAVADKRAQAKAAEDAFVAKLFQFDNDEDDLVAAGDVGVLPEKGRY